MKETDIERIRRYVDQVKIGPPIIKRYDISFNEVCALKEELSVSGFGVIKLAFTYGRAKGYRAAKAEGNCHV